MRGALLPRPSQVPPKFIERIKSALHKAIWMLVQWILSSRGIWPWRNHQTQPGSLYTCSVPELPELPKPKKAKWNHCTEAVLPARDPSWLQQKSESINSITWTLYAWCCSTAFPKAYQLTCITRIFSFSTVTQFSVIFSVVQQNYINLALKWLSLLRDYLKCIDNTHLNCQALCVSVFFIFQFYYVPLSLISTIISGQH